MEKCEHDNIKSTGLLVHTCDSNNSFIYSEYLCKDCGKKVYERFDWVELVDKIPDEDEVVKITIQKEVE